MVTKRWLVLALIVAACGDGTPPLQTAEPGVVFTYPIDHQIDVPLGARIVVTFSDPVVESALGTCNGSSGGFCLVAPDGSAVIATPEVSADKKSVAFTAPLMKPGTTYQLFASAVLAPTATNLPASGPLLSFTTRTSQPKSAVPSLVAVNGGEPANPTSMRPMFESSTIRLVFSEPLDPRTVVGGANSVELVEQATGAPVAATVIAQGIHVAIDPVDDLTAGTTYELRLGSAIRDLGGTALGPTTVTLVPDNTKGAGTIAQVLRTKGPSDPGPATTRAGTDANVIALDKPLIGKETVTLQPSTLAAELGDPKALGGPIAFTIRRGQRLAATGLDVKLGGQIPVGLSTGDIQIELLTDGGGRIYRNPYQKPDQRPENDRAPLYVDLSLDLAIYAVDPLGNAVLAQTVLGVEATGTAVATDGVLAIESVASIEMGLLGVTEAPSNLVLQLITDPSATPPVDTTPPALVATTPADGTAEHEPGDGIELVFDEPIDLDRARAGGITLTTSAGASIAAVIESHGSAVVVRPTSRLPYSTSFQVTMSDIADVAGNAMPGQTLAFSTPTLFSTGVPLTALATHPGVPCALTAASGGSPGRCAGGLDSDDLYHPFTLAANEPVEVVFSQPPIPSTIALGTACDTGSVRIEEVDAIGTCIATVPGTLLVRGRSLQFVPDEPWVVGRRYRAALISGGDGSCNGGEICGINGGAASFDPLNGTESGDSGGGAIALAFVGGEPSASTYLVAEAGPYTDINANGFLDGGELRRDGNRAALTITGTTGSVSNARFEGEDCLPATPEVDGCLYLQGAMPVELGEVTSNCPLPGGATAPACIPVVLGAQAMFGTSVRLTASVGISISTDTGTNVLRIREPTGGAPTGFIIDKNGAPTMVLALDLYMDAPDMSITLSSHDLHSKPLTVSLEGPVDFLPDGRIAIGASNLEDVPVEVNIDAPLGIGGSVQMILRRGEMKLQLVSRPLRGAER
ncbi:MAG TPA: Ig-like domain-containing protein [Kofleriaceae bacterium]|nr:Ig-like domain-containing protein [Kofleriaceae bacterium]